MPPPTPRQLREAYGHDPEPDYPDDPTDWIDESSEEDYLDDLDE